MGAVRCGGAATGAAAGVASAIGGRVRIGTDRAFMDRGRAGAGDGATVRNAGGVVRMALARTAAGVDHTITRFRTRPLAYRTTSRRFAQPCGVMLGTGFFRPEQAMRDAAARCCAEMSLPRKPRAAIVPARGHSGSGMNSVSPGTVSKRPAFQSALACSIRSRREDTKFHQM